MPYKTNISFDLLELSSRSSDKQFTEQEKDFIKTKVRKKDFKINYAIYRKKSGKGLYISFIVDSSPQQKRRTLAYNNYEIIFTEN